jgi:hypothetical protein
MDSSTVLARLYQSQSGFVCDRDATLEIYNATLEIYEVDDYERHNYRRGAPRQHVASVVTHHSRTRFLRGSNNWLLSRLIVHEQLQRRIHRCGL